MYFNIKDAPFCSYGSTLVISYIEGRREIEDGLYIRSLQGGDNFVSNLFKIDLTYKGEVVLYDVEFTATRLRLYNDKGQVDFVISEDNLMAINGKKLGLRLSMETGAYDNAIPIGLDQWEINSYSEEIKLLLSPILGELKVDAPWERMNSKYIVIDIDPIKERLEVYLHSYKTSRKLNYYDNFEDIYEDNQESYEDWLDGMAKLPEELERGKEAAAYYTWSCVVNPQGVLTRPSIYMSKRYMGNIWSWDNCFNAMALLDRDLKLAWDQIMVFFDVQARNGQIPDFMNDVYLSWSCTKPPIHGWAIKWMMDRSGFIDEDMLLDIFEPLENWTSWWFDYRDYDKDGIPCYNHGNDSGWDNSTVFKDRPPIKSPDLLAYLIYQMDVLAEIADLLGKKQKARYWKKRADESLEDLIDYFYDGRRFVAKKAFSHEPINSDSLLLYMPVVLGDRLPREIIDNLLEDLKEEGSFLSSYGLATEKMTSQLFREDGYWRGPIWAPTTMIIFDALVRLGEEDFARELGYNFCKMASRGGMTENYSPLTGEALYENAFTMTASVYLILVEELYRE